MSYTTEYVEEMEVLMLFDLSSTQEGIKIHKQAEATKIAAAERLFKKGFTTLIDGGYLTDIGREAAKHTQFLHTMLKVS